MIKKQCIFTITALCLLLFLVSLLIIPASAQTLNGTLGGSGVSSQRVYDNLVSSGGGETPTIGYLYVYDIEYTQGLTALIRFDAGIRPTFSDSVTGDTSLFNATVGGVEIGHGTLGFARIFVNGVEQDGYQWYVFDTWNLTSLIGSQTITINYDVAKMHGLTYGNNYALPPAEPILGKSGMIGINNNANNQFALGRYQITTSSSFFNSYSATKPSGLGIEGYIFKHGENDAVFYNSKAFVFNGTDNSILTSQLLLSNEYLYFNVPANTVKLGVLDSLNNWHNTSVLFSPIPTPPPVSYDTWSLSANPTSISLGEPTLLVADCSNLTKKSAPILRTVLYYDNPNLGTSQPSLIGVMRWNVSSSNWDFRTNNSAAWDFSAHLPTEMEFIPASGGSHSLSVYTFDVNSISLGSATTSLSVAGSGSLGSVTILFGAYDGSTTSHLSDYDLTITNDITGAVRSFTGIAYDLSFNVAKGTTYTITGDKEGYDHATKTITIPLNIVQGSIEAISIGGIPLYPIGTLSAGNTTVTVHVDDIETYQPLGGVQIVIAGQTPKYTGSDGASVSFILPQNTLVTVQAIKEGYCSVSMSKNTSTYDTLYYPMEMKFGACFVTPTHTPIPTNTTPFPTQIGGSNASAAVCQLNMSANATYVDQGFNWLACNGIRDKTGQNLAISLFLMILCGIILGKYGKGIGVLAGIVAGAAISFGAALLPIWILIVVIICVGIVFGAKLLGSSGA